MYEFIFRRAPAACALIVVMSPALWAQEHEHMADMPDMQMDMPGWQFMQDGIVSAVLNHQGGPRGGDDVNATNWWMGMATRRVGSHQVTLAGMFSLEPATAGRDGYREIFQVGEALDGYPLVDRQHPHDFFMQLAATWRAPLSDTTSLTIAGGPAGEPALGPVAFMHRASAAGIVLAPLGHHTFDSSHISYGVATAAVERARWTVEGSVFNGREPDDDRWDLDLGKMDSIAGRVWFRPNNRWSLQVSTGHLVEPEPLEEGNITRTTASASMWRGAGDAFQAMTIGVGVNAAHDRHRGALFGEFTHQAGANTVSARIEVVQVETDLLLAGGAPAAPADDRVDTLGTATIGGVRRIMRWRGFEGAVGANLSLYAVPSALQPTYSDHPVSFQVFLQLRPPAGPMGRMWNMRMGQ